MSFIDDLEKDLTDIRPKGETRFLSNEAILKRQVIDFVLERIHKHNSRAAKAKNPKKIPASRRRAAE